VSTTEDNTPAGADLRKDGVAFADVPEGGMLVGHHDDDGVLLVKKNGTVHAMGAKCTHYGGPLGEGAFDGTCVRCPWHNAGFRPDTGEAVHAPAIDPVATYAVERRGDRVFVTGPRNAPVPRAAIASPPASVVIVGGGAAGFAAAEMLRREGYEGPVTVVSADSLAPYDRPNVSKDYLAGTAPEEWMPLRPLDWYGKARIDLMLGGTVARLSPAERVAILDDGRRLPYGALLLATGATPTRLDVPGADRPHVHTLRSMADAGSIIRSAEGARHAVVLGTSFIGLEAAAALAARGLEVHVVGQDAVPMERVLGPELGGFVRGLHEEHGVRFHMRTTILAIDDGAVTLKDGTAIAADLVVVGIGVRPDLRLAEAAGLAVDRGVIVDAFLRTSDPAIWAAGDIARWPDPASGEAIRVEHWVVAERQGQTAARNMLGRGERYDAVPFFWSQHYDVRINYVGHASSGNESKVMGDVAAGDGVVAYRNGGRTVAVAAVNRDALVLRVQLALERGDAAAVDAALEAARGNR
jgi:apoptosis-inducing factor 3